MVNGYTAKSQIIGAMLKPKGLFKVAHIVEITGIERTLIHYHANKLSEQGLLIRTGNAFSVRSHDELLDYLLSDVEVPGNRLMETKGIFSEQGVKSFNSMVQCLVAGRALDLPDSHELIVLFNKMLDDTTTEIRALKRYLNNTQLSKRKAVDTFSHRGTLKNLDTWDSILTQLDFTPTYNTEDMADIIERRVDDEIKGSRNED